MEALTQVKPDSNQILALPWMRSLQISHIPILKNKCMTKTKKKIKVCLNTLAQKANYYIKPLFKNSAQCTNLDKLSLVWGIGKELSVVYMKPF
jgi:hypothetical protein